jgi:hypothetical protein
MADEPVDARDLTLAQRQVGLTANGRLAWAVRFAHADPATFTSADWSRWRLELTAFARLRLSYEGLLDRRHTHDLASADRYRYGNDVYSREQTAKIHDEFGRIIGQWLDSNDVTIGTFRMTLIVSRPPAASVQEPQRPYLSRGDLQEFPEQATYALGNLLGALGHLVKVCRAPVAWGKGTPCGRWFVATRATQEHCSPRCQNRATTRAIRQAARAKKAPRPSSATKRRARR